MADATISLLIARPTDLALAAVQLSGVLRLPPGGDGVERVLTGADARARLVLPPQSVAESLLGPGVASAAALLGGPSALEFALDADVEIALTAEGLLAAVAASGRLRPSSAVGAEGTRVELPWGIVGSPVARALADAVTSEHPAAPRLSPTGAVGLWQARLRADDGLLFQPLEAKTSDLSTALTNDHRGRIVVEGRARPAAATIALGALGATASLRLATDTFEWSHALAQGRDARVRVVSRGMVYPFGHRAVLIESTDRRITETADGQVAGLQATETRLVFTERVRGYDRRDFPFESVEILTDSVALARAHGTPFVRRSAALAAHVATLQAERDATRASVDGRLAAIPNPPTEEFLAEQGSPEAAALPSQRELVATLSAQLDEAIAQFEDRNAPPPAPGVIERLQRDLRAAQDDLQRLEAAVAAQLAGLPRTFEQLVAVGDFEAVRVVELDAQIAALTAGVQQGIEVAFLPQRVDLQTRAGVSPVRVPLRCHGTVGPVEFVTPILFVHDIRLNVAEHLEDFTSLDDAETQAALAERWEPHSRVALAGVAIDLVRDGALSPGDAHEVHAMRVVSGGFDGAYVPRLDQIEAGLPAWRTLLPGRDDRVSLRYASGVPGPGPVPDLALVIDPPVRLDFAGRAERSGGLVVPRFEVGGVSRRLGAVPTSPGPSGGSRLDALRVFTETTLLGFPLLELLADPGAIDRSPPSGVVPQPTVGGLPGARFEWPKLPLRDHDLFDAGPASTLDLTVEAAPDSTRTTCAVTDFALVLPPAAPLLRLDVASLTFQAVDGRPPAIGITGLQVSFGKELRLLNGLQEKLQAALDDPGAGVAVRQTPNGVRAGYSVAIPEASSGGFVLRNAHASLVVDVPFTGGAVTTSLAFARPDNPFALTVLALGGGGYVVVEVGAGGRARVDVSLEFGAMVAVDLRVVTAEVHALGGVRITGDGRGIVFAAFIRLGGSVDLLGLVSVSVELKLMLAYDGGANRLVGRATLVIEVDLLFFAKSLELDSGEWVLAGDELPESRPADGPVPLAGPLGDSVDGGAGGRVSRAPPVPADVTAAKAAWLGYQEAFAA